MGTATVDDILLDLPLGFASLILRPDRAESPIERFLIVDADDETSDGGAAFVLLIGVRGRSALPALRRLLKNPPLVLAVKGGPGELGEAEELLRAAGTGLLLVDPAADWDRLLSIAKDRIQPRSYQSEVLTLLEEDLFAIAQTTARLTSSHVVIEDAANKVLAYSTVTNDIDELRKASILARRGPRKYELLLKDLGAYRELHRTRLPVRVPARPQDGLRERVAITPVRRRTHHGVHLASGNRRRFRRRRRLCPDRIGRAGVSRADPLPQRAVGAHARGPDCADPFGSGRSRRECPQREDPRGPPLGTDPAGNVGR